MIDPVELIADGHDPASDLEERETKEAADDRPIEDYSAAMGRLLAWFLEGTNLAQIGLRVLVCVHKLRPDLIGGMSFAEIAAMAGFGRSAAHNLSDDFETTFPIRGILDKPALARLRYRRRHGFAKGEGPASVRLNPAPGRPRWAMGSSQPARSRAKG